ncbi:SLC13 family permease, partial [Hyphomonas atlantica]
VMGLAALGVLPIAALALIAATAVVALGCLDHQEAYRAIRWDILMLIFGMLALGLAMEKSGAASLLVGHLAELTAGFGPIAVLAVLYLVTSFLTEIMSNNAAAILLTPIAIGLGAQLGIDPRPFVVAVMFAASASFATPIGYQTNTLVYSAGGYRFSDFLKIGVPLNLVMFAAAMIVIPMFWPLG